MRRTLLFALCCLLGTACLHARSEHLAFKGVPIDGTLAEFSKKLEATGLKKCTVEDTEATLFGLFAGYKNCAIKATAANADRIVSKVEVIFPADNEWKALYAKYSALKTMLVSKYGEPTSITEEFDTNSKIEGWEIYLLKMNRCNYVCTFALEEGTIELSLADVSATGTYTLKELKRLFLSFVDESSIGTCVILRYYDKLNTDLSTSSALEDL